MQKNDAKDLAASIAQYLQNNNASRQAYQGPTATPVPKELDPSLKISDEARSAARARYHSELMRKPTSAWTNEEREYLRLGLHEFGKSQ